MNPFPPLASTASVRAWAMGSSGLGKGMRSMTTSWHVSPGRSTPCHSIVEPNRQARGSSRKRASRVET